MMKTSNWMTVVATGLALVLTSQMVRAADAPEPPKLTDDCGAVLKAGYTAALVETGVDASRAAVAWQVFTVGFSALVAADASLLDHSRAYFKGLDVARQSPICSAQTARLDFLRDRTIANMADDTAKYVLFIGFAGAKADPATAAARQ